MSGKFLPEGQSIDALAVLIVILGFGLRNALGERGGLRIKGRERLAECGRRRDKGRELRSFCAVVLAAFRKHIPNRRKFVCGLGFRLPERRFGALKAEAGFQTSFRRMFACFDGGLQGSAVCAEIRQVTARQSGSGGFFFGCGQKQCLFRLKIGGLALGCLGA